MQVDAHGTKVEKSTRARDEWAALHAELAREAGAASFVRRFQFARGRALTLWIFPRPQVLLEYLHRPAAPELDAKDGIYCALVNEAQRGPDPKLAVTLLWLGLWPGLDHFVRRHPASVRARAELLSTVALMFTMAIRTLNVATTNRFAATLLCNVERDVGKASRQRWTLSAPPGFVRGDAVEPSVFGLSPGLGAEARSHALRCWLDQRLGADGALVFRTVVAGEAQAAVGAELGLTHEVTRKRIQRALLRLRRALEEKSSEPCPISTSDPAFSQ